jgi:hypothetical protein
MLANFTIFLLTATSRRSNGAPLFMSVHRLMPSHRNFGRLSMAYHTSPFLFSAGRPSFSITNSKFTHFLRSAILISTYDLPGLSRATDPLTPEESFNCTQTIFEANSSPYNGAAISVSSSSAITAIFTSVNFIGNSGGIGGAIFFSSLNGWISLDRCHFQANAAACGSHFLVKTLHLTVSDSVFTRSIGDRSAIETAADTNVSFSNCNFFQDIGFIRLLNPSSAVFRDCCLMNYTDSGDFHYSDFPFNGDALLTLENTYINAKFAAGKLPLNEWPAVLDDEVESGGEQCRLEPTPSATVEARFSSGSGIVAVVALVFPLVASVLGVVLVLCRQRRPVDFDDATHSEFGLMELEE